jgi:hypothetical protein
MSWPPLVLTWPKLLFITVCGGVERALDMATAIKRFLQKPSEKDYRLNRYISLETLLCALKLGPLGGDE